MRNPKKKTPQGEGNSSSRTKEKRRKNNHEEKGKKPIHLREKKGSSLFLEEISTNFRRRGGFYRKKEKAEFFGREGTRHVAARGGSHLPPLGEGRVVSGVGVQSEKKRKEKGGVAPAVRKNEKKLPGRGEENRGVPREQNKPRFAFEEKKAFGMLRRKGKGKEIKRVKRFGGREERKERRLVPPPRKKKKGGREVLRERKERKRGTLLKKGGGGPSISWEKKGERGEGVYDRQRFAGKARKRKHPRGQERKEEKTASPT